MKVVLLLERNAAPERGVSALPAFARHYLELGAESIHVIAPRSQATSVAAYGRFWPVFAEQLVGDDAPWDALTRVRRLLRVFQGAWVMVARVHERIELPWDLGTTLGQLHAHRMGSLPCNVVLRPILAEGEDAPCIPLPRDIRRPLFFNDRGDLPGGGGPVGSGPAGVLHLLGVPAPDTDGDPFPYSRAELERRGLLRPAEATLGSRVRARATHLALRATTRTGRLLLRPFGRGGA